MENRKCTKCNIEKSLEEFYKKKKGYYHECKSCSYIRTKLYHKKNKNRIWQSRNKDYIKKATLKRVYNITIEEYDALLLKQNNLCAICQLPESITDKRTSSIFKLSVDHCHLTNKVRGLLCGRCNKAIGLLNDNIQLLEQAIKYLNK